MANAVYASPDARARLGFLRIKQVLELIPIARSSWWEGVKSGRFPKPMKLGPHTTVWFRADIEALIANSGNSQVEQSGRAALPAVKHSPTTSHAGARDAAEPRQPKAQTIAPAGRGG